MPDGPSPWPCFQHDARHTGRMDAAGPAAGASFARLFGVPSTITTGLVVAPDGSLVFVAANADVYAYAPDGTQRWAFHMANMGTGDPTPWVTPEGTIYAGGDRLYALEAAGQQQWAYPDPSTGTRFYVSGGPVVGADGTTYVAGTESKSTPGAEVRAVSPDGELVWRTALDGIGVSLALGSDGTLNVGTQAGTVYALDPGDGSVTWETPWGSGYAVLALVVGDDGTVYAALMERSTNHGWLCAIGPGGLSSWQLQTNQVVYGRSTPALGPDGTVYFGCGSIFAVDPATGRQKWRVGDSTSFIPFSLVVDPGGTVFYMDYGGRYGSVQADGSGFTRSQVSGVTVNSYLAAGADGALYIGIGSAVYGLAAASPPPTGVPALTWATTGPQQLQQAPADGSAAPAALLDTGTTAFGLATDEAGTLYWSDGNARIRRLDGSAAVDAVTGLGFYAYGIAVADGFVYAADPDKGTLWKIPLDGNRASVLVQRLKLPCDVAVDTASGALYWAEYGGVIGTAALDGSGARALYTGLAKPQGVAVAGGTLYWIADDGVYSGPAGGGTAVRLATLGPGRPSMISRRVAIDPAAETLYWTDQASNAIYAQDSAGGLPAPVVSGLSNPTVLALKPASG